MSIQYNKYLGIADYQDIYFSFLAINLSLLGWISRDAVHHFFSLEAS